MNGGRGRASRRRLLSRLIGWREQLPRGGFCKQRDKHDNECQLPKHFFPANRWSRIASWFGGHRCSDDPTLLPDVSDSATADRSSPTTIFSAVPGGFPLPSAV